MTVDFMSHIVLSSLPKYSNVKSKSGFFNKVMIFPLIVIAFAVLIKHILFHKNC